MSKYNTYKCCRLDPDTLAMLKESAERENMSESAYIRDLIRRDHAAVIGLPAEEFITMNRQLAGAATNINQIAHNVNMQAYTPYDAEKLSEDMSVIAETRMLLAEIKGMMLTGKKKRRRRQGEGSG